MNKRKIGDITRVIVLAGIVSVALAYADFTPAPPGLPPNCPVGYPGCDAPINVGTSTQSKLGQLMVNTDTNNPFAQGLIAFGHTVLNAGDGDTTAVEVNGDTQISGDNNVGGDDNVSGNSNVAGTISAGGDVGGTGYVSTNTGLCIKGKCITDWSQVGNTFNTPTGKAFIDFAFGDYGGTTCGIVANSDSTKDLYCSGWNGWGALGNGDTNSKKIFTLVSGMRGVSAITGSTGHFCAVLGGIVKCWGYNPHGETGIGSNAPSLVKTPTAIANILTQDSTGKFTVNGGVIGGSAGSVVDIQANKSYWESDGNPLTYSTTCVLLSTGRVSCWGDNYHGGLGQNTPEINTIRQWTPSYVLQDVPNTPLGNVTAIRVGGGSEGPTVCALLSDTSARCWGYNAYGQLGISTMSSANNNPANLILALDPVFSGPYVGGTAPTLYGIKDIQLNNNTSYAHACALLNNGDVYCWGNNAYGQVGNNTTVNQLYAVKVLSGASEVKVGSLGKDSNGGWTCAIISADGSVKCWGYNGYGQLGNGNRTSQKLPVQVINPDGSILTGAKDLVLGSVATCAVMADGGVKCWGLNTSGELGVPNTTTVSAYAVSTVGFGSGAGNVQAKSIRIGGINSDMNCAIIQDNTARCWGWNGNGPLGTGDGVSVFTPVQPQAGS